MNKPICSSPNRRALVVFSLKLCDLLHGGFGITEQQFYTTFLRRRFQKFYDALVAEAFLDNKHFYAFAEGSEGIHVRAEVGQ